jgi:hypothetical protein
MKSNRPAPLAVALSLGLVIVSACSSAPTESPTATAAQPGAAARPEATAIDRSLTTPPDHATVAVGKPRPDGPESTCGGLLQPPCEETFWTITFPYCNSGLNVDPRFNWCDYCGVGVMSACCGPDSPVAAYCVASGTVCSGSYCVACGAAGDLPCAGDVPCNAGTALGPNGTCVTCGDFNQPVCAGGVCYQGVYPGPLTAAQGWICCPSGEQALPFGQCTPLTGHGGPGAGDDDDDDDGPGVGGNDVLPVPRRGVVQGTDTRRTR